VSRFYFDELPVRINQGVSAHKLCVKNVPNKPHFKYVLNFLVTKGYINCTYNVDQDNFTVFPKYIAPTGQPVLTRFRHVSTPGNRRYVKLHQLRSLVYNHRPSMVHYIVSTRLGFMTAQEAYKKRLGGELIYEI